MKLEYEEIIKRNREEKDFFFKGHPQSPLTHEQQHSFKKLDYFPVNKDLKFEVELEEFNHKNEIEIQTSTGDIQYFVDFGTVSFEVTGKRVSLHVYVNQQNPHHYFVPFWDLTVQTKETYGAGRYIELESTGTKKFELDFNMAYNPYCAYNERWTCPLVPPANRLNVRIEAGEKKFKQE